MDFSFVGDALPRRPATIAPSNKPPDSNSRPNGYGGTLFQIPSYHEVHAPARGPPGPPSAGGTAVWRSPPQGATTSYAPALPHHGAGMHNLATLPVLSAVPAAMTSPLPAPYPAILQAGSNQPYNQSYNQPYNHQPPPMGGGGNSIGSAGGGASSSGPAGYVSAGWRAPPAPQQQQQHLLGGCHSDTGWSGGTGRGLATSSGPGTHYASAPQQSNQQQQHISTNAIIVSKRQQGNPLLKHIRNVRWQHADISPDYLIGQSSCALFISLRYHLLHPEYLMHRIKEQQRGGWGLVLLLCHIDVEDVVKPLREVTRAAAINGCTLVCAWSPEECARYLETFKSYESKPASSIQERVEADYMSRLTAALTSSVRGVNRTDATTLATARGSLADLLRSTPEQLSACPGIGPTKVQRLLEAFQQPFRREVGASGRASAAPSDPSTSQAGGLLRGAAATSAVGSHSNINAQPVTRTTDVAAGSRSTSGDGKAALVGGSFIKNPADGHKVTSMGMMAVDDDGEGGFSSDFGTKRTDSFVADQGEDATLSYYPHLAVEEDDELLYQATQLLARVEDSATCRASESPDDEEEERDHESL